MAALARYGSVSPDEFGRMTPARTRRLHAAVERLVQDEWRGLWELVLQQARFMAQVRGG